MKVQSRDTPVIGGWRQSYRKRQDGQVRMNESYYFHFPDKITIWLAEVLGRSWERVTNPVIFENKGWLDYHPDWLESSPRTTRLRADEVVALVTSNPEMKGAWILKRMKEGYQNQEKS